MQRFIAEQNIALFQRLLLKETNEGKRQLLRSLLLNSQRQLAMIESASRGAYSTAILAKERIFLHPTPRMTSQFQQEFETATTPLLLIDPRPGLHIVDANHCYASATMIEEGKVAGERLFDIFPDNPTIHWPTASQAFLLQSISSRKQVSRTRCRSSDTMYETHMANLSRGTGNQPIARCSASVELLPIFSIRSSM